MLPPSSRLSTSSRHLTGEVPWLRLLYLYPSGLTDRTDRRSTGDRRAVLRPLAAARLATAASFDASVGRRGALPCADRADPRARANRDVPLVLHPRVPRGDRRGPASTRRVPRGRPARLGWLLHLLRRGRDPSDVPRRQVPVRTRARAACRVQRAPGRDHEPRRDALVGQTQMVLVDSPGNARSIREAPEIDGIIAVPAQLAVGEFHEVVITGSFGTDLLAMPA